MARGLYSVEIPVRVVMDQKSSGEAKVRSSVDRMLKDQLNAIEKANREQLRSERQAHVESMRILAQKNRAIQQSIREQERATKSAATAQAREATRAARQAEQEMRRQTQAVLSLQRQRSAALISQWKTEQREQVRIARETERQIAATQAESRRARSAFISGAIGGVTALIGVSAVSEIRAAGAAWLDYSSKLETTKIAFTTMLGSAEAAQAHLTELQNFALKTPFQFGELIDASQRMQALGFNAQQVVPILTDVGNAVAAAGGGSERLDRVTLALSQVQSKGKVMTQEMNQLAEAGLNGWKMLEIQLGKSGNELREMVKDGEISSAVFLEAFQKFSRANFGGLMEAQAKTFSGAMSNIKDAALQASEVALRPLYERISDIARAMAESSTNSEEFKGKMESLGSVATNTFDGLVEVAHFVKNLWRGAIEIIIGTVIAWIHGVMALANAIRAAMFYVEALIKLASGDWVGALQTVDRGNQQVQRSVEELGEAVNARLGVFRLFGEIWTENAERSEAAAARIAAAAMKVQMAGVIAGVQTTASATVGGGELSSASPSGTTTEDSKTSAQRSKAERAARDREIVSAMKSKIDELAADFMETFGKALPMRFGQTGMHSKLNYDHRAAADISLDARTAEGRFVMEWLQDQGINARASLGREISAKTGKLISTGTHIHAGELSGAMGRGLKMREGLLSPKGLKEEQERAQGEFFGWSTSEIQKALAQDRRNKPATTTATEDVELPTELTGKWNLYYDEVEKRENALRDRRKDYADEYRSNYGNLITEVGNLDLDLKHLRQQAADDQFSEQRRLLLAKQEEIDLTRQVIAVQDDLANGPLNSSLRIQLALLQDINSLRRRDEEAIISQNRAQLELADAEVFHGEQARANVLDHLSRAKSQTELFSDAIIGAYEAVNDVVLQGVQKITGGIRVLDNLIAGLISRLANRLFQKLLDVLVPGGGGGGGSSTGGGGGIGSMFSGIFGGGQGVSAGRGEGIPSPASLSSGGPITSQMITAMAGQENAAAQTASGGLGTAAGMGNLSSLASSLPLLGAAYGAGTWMSILSGKPVSTFQAITGGGVLGFLLNRQKQRRLDETSRNAASHDTGTAIWALIDQARFGDMGQSEADRAWNEIAAAYTEKTAAIKDGKTRRNAHLQWTNDFMPLKLILDTAVAGSVQRANSRARMSPVFASGGYNPETQLIRYIGGEGIRYPGSNQVLTLPGPNKGYDSEYMYAPKGAQIIPVNEMRNSRGYASGGTVGGGGMNTLHIDAIEVYVDENGIARAVVKTADFGEAVVHRVKVARKDKKL